MSGKIHSYLVFIALLGAIVPAAAQAQQAASPPPAPGATVVTTEAKPGAPAPAPGADKAAPAPVPGAAIVTTDKKPAPAPGAAPVPAPAPAPAPALVTTSKQTPPPAADADVHGLLPLKSWGEVQKLFMPEPDGQGHSIPVGVQLEQDPVTFAYGRATLRGAIMEDFDDCGPGKTTDIDLDEDLKIIPIAPTPMGDDKGNTKVEQGFTVMASKALQDCMAFAKSKHKICSQAHPCLAASELGGSLDALQEGSNSQLAYCAPTDRTAAIKLVNGDSTDDLNCASGKTLTPSALLKKNADKVAKAEKIKKDNARAEDLENDVTACEKALEGGDLDAFFKASNAIVAEGKFLDKNKKGNKDLQQKAEDFNEDDLENANFKKALEAMLAAADKWEPKKSGSHSEDGDKTLENLRKKVHEIVQARLENSSDRAANRALAEDVLKVYDRISANYREKAMKSNDLKQIQSLLAEATSTYQDAKKERIFDSDQKGRIDEQIGLLGKLKDQIVYAQRDLRGNPGNPSTDIDLMKQLAAKANAACGGNGGTPSAATVQAAEINSPQLSGDCADYSGWYAAAYQTLIASCQNAFSQYRSGFPSSNLNTCMQYVQAGVIPQQAIAAVMMGGQATNALGGALAMPQQQNGLMAQNGIFGANRTLAGGMTNIYGLNPNLGGAQQGVVTNGFNAAACLGSQTGTGCW